MGLFVFGLFVAVPLFIATVWCGAGAVLAVAVFSICFHNVLLMFWVDKVVCPDVFIIAKPVCVEQYVCIPTMGAKKDCIFYKVDVYYCACRGVAQPGRVLAWGARGRKFESCHPDQKFKPPGGGFNFWIVVADENLFENE